MPNGFIVQNIYDGGGVHTDSYASQIGADRIIIYGRTGNDQLIACNRKLLLVIFK